MHEHVRGSSCDRLADVNVLVRSFLTDAFICTLTSQVHAHMHTQLHGHISTQPRLACPLRALQTR